MKGETSLITIEIFFLTKKKKSYLAFRFSSNLNLVFEFLILRIKSLDFAKI
jgi:hypothetical protein